VTRVCAQCLTRRPGPELARRADSWACTDQAACAQRAAASGVYGEPESGRIRANDLAIGSARRAMYGPDPSLDGIERTLAAERAADREAAEDLNRLEGALDLR
jgi:hypothetical protein